MFGKRMYIEGVILQPFEAEQLTENWEAYWDWEVTRYTHLWYSPTKKSLKEWVEKAGSEKDYVSWGVFLEDEPDRLIGTTSLKLVKPYYVGETGIILFDKRKWGKRVATRAHLGRTWSAHRDFDLKTILSGVMEPNEGSRKALENHGYFQTGYHHGVDYVDGKYVDFIDLQWVSPDYVDRILKGKFPTSSEEIAVIMAQETLDHARSTVRYG